MKVLERKDVSQPPVSFPKAAMVPRPRVPSGAHAALLSCTHGGVLMHTAGPRFPVETPISRLNSSWSIRTVECYSAVTRNKVLIHPKTWMNLRSILLSERSQTPRATTLTPFMRQKVRGFQDRGWREGVGAAVIDCRES